MKISILKNIYEYFKYLFDIKHDKDEEGTIENIKKAIEFKGENLWALICAIFIASIGLNTNSTAVIIGAMLISPLMSPIIGVGLAVGINDFQLLKTSLKNLLISVIASIITSTLYFSLSPLSEVQSELLARTNPTTFDVLIALFGGIAGIMAHTRKEKSNVIPGVAIATALMPPLCTAGYGLATGNFLFFIGAFYLFFINSVFICIATIFIVKYLGFKEVQYIDSKRQKTINKYIFIFAIITILPSTYTAWNLINESLFKSRAIKFVNENTKFQNTKLINSKFNYMKTGTSFIEVTFIGETIQDKTIIALKSLMESYKLKNVELIVNQSKNNMGEIEKQFSKMNEKLKYQLIEELYKNNNEEIKNKDLKIKALEKNINNYKNEIKNIKQKNADNNMNRLIKELSVFYPNIQSFSYSTATKKDSSNLKSNYYPLVVIKWKEKPNSIDKDRVLQFLRVRTVQGNLELINM